VQTVFLFKITGRWFIIPVTWGIIIIMSKNIVVVTSAVPFYYGGNERLAENLAYALNKAGYSARPFFTPRNRYDSFKTLLMGYAANRFTDLGGFPWKEPIDQIISIAYPSFVVKHPHHVCWFAHRMREYYDLWDRWIGREKSFMSRTRLRVQKKILHTVDSYYLSKLEKLYCISSGVGDRLKRWGGFDAEVLHPPPRDDSSYKSTVYKPYIFAISRLTSLKRIDLLVNAMRYIKNEKITAVIAGEGEERAGLERLAKRHGLENKIRFTGAVSEREKHKLFSECRAFFFAPYNEEYGIVTVEAMKRSKAVITAKDSGGPLDFVRNNQNGFIVEPNPCEIAGVIDKLADDELSAKKMGENALKTVEDVTWENVIKKLIIV